jgi:ParB-like chromosome segregation protein Spo0J
MDAFTYSKVIDSILEYGPIDPITNRPQAKRDLPWQILDGEHRWRGYKDLGITECPAFSTGDIPDTQAMKITITLNELKGQYDPRDMAKLLQRLMQDEDPIKLAKSLPFTDVALQGMIGLSDLSLGDSPISRALGEGEAIKKQRERWVERVFRLTIEMNGIVQQALDKAKDGEEMSDVQALEMVCADFLAGE